MVKHLLLLLSVFILIGCGSSTQSSADSAEISSSENLSDSDDSSQTSEESSSETESSEDDSTDEESTDEESDSEESIDYSLISCADELESVLTLINELRSEAQTCGSTSYPAVTSLTWNDSLYEAAKEHADNMANYDFFSHTGLDESSVGDRVSDTGYSWSYVAENIAAGQTSAQTVVDAWMTSEGHCKNIMNENVTDMALACTVNSDATYKRYWVQVFAKPF